MPEQGDFRQALVMMVAVLLSFGTSWLLRYWAHLGVDISVIAFVLPVMFWRVKPTDFKHTMLELMTIAFVSVGAHEVVRLFVTHPNYADALFVVCLSAGIYLRRWGGTFRRIGTLLSLPFIAGLVVPVPVTPGSHEAYWDTLMSVVAFVLVQLVRLLFEKVGFLKRLEHEQPKIEKQAPSKTRRVSASTSMSLQMAVALSLAFVFGRLIYGHHWPWVVLTTYIVASGTRNRAEVLYKGFMRIGGALVGTAIATVISGAVPKGNAWAIIGIFVIIGVAGWLRNANYAYWAAAVTASLSLLYGYFGERGTAYLDERLGGMVIGGAVAVLAAWFVLPVSATDVFRKRCADALLALQNMLIVIRDGNDNDATRVAMHKSVKDLHDLRPPLLFGHRDKVHQIDAVRHSARVADKLTVADADEIQKLLEEVVHLRKSLRRNYS